MSLHPFRILIVDDHALLVEGLCNLLASRGFDIVGTAADGREGIEEALRLNPDLVLMDVRMPVLDGLAATRLLKAQRPHIQIVMLTTSAEDEDLFEAIKSGASGYLLKSTKGTAFIEALHSLAEGTPPFSPGLAARLLREFARQGEPTDEKRQESEKRANGDARRPQLTDRQKEVLSLVASGLTYKEVAARLNLSDHTVRYHMTEIMELLHLENRSQVIAYAGKLGIQ